MRTDKYMMAKAWMKQDQAPQAEALDTWNTLEAEFNEERKAMLMASAESDKIKAMMNEKYGPGTVKYGSEIKQPEMKTPQAIFEFSQRNPAAEGGRMGFNVGLRAKNTGIKLPAKQLKLLKDNLTAEEFKKLKFGERTSRVDNLDYGVKQRDNNKLYKKVVNILNPGAQSVGIKILNNEKLSTALIKSTNAGDDIQTIITKMNKLDKSLSRNQISSAINSLIKRGQIDEEFGRVAGKNLSIGEQQTYNKIIEEAVDEGKLNRAQIARKAGVSDSVVEDWIRENKGNKFYEQNFDYKSGRLKTGNLQIKKDLFEFVESSNKISAKEIAQNFNLDSKKTQKVMSDLVSDIYRMSGGREGGSIIVPYEDEGRMREVLRKIRNAPDFEDIYQRRIETLVTEAFPANSKAQLQAKKSLSEYRKFSRALKETFPELALNLDHVVPFQFLKEVKQGANPINLIRVKPTIGSVNRFKTNFDNARIELNRLNQINSNNPEVKKRFKILNDLQKNIGIEFGGTSKGGYVYNFGAKPIGQSDLIGDSKKVVSDYQKVGEFSKKVLADKNLQKQLIEAGVDTGKDMAAFKKITPFSDKEFREIIKVIGCPKFEKAEGGRIGFDEGGDCFDKGQKLVNSGMDGASKASMRNFSNVANRLFKMGAAVTKYGIIPEAVLIAADTAIRMDLGDTFEEGLLRAADYLTPDSIFGDFKQKADLLKVDRTFSPEMKKIVAQSFGYNNQLEKIKSLKNEKKNLKLMSGDGGAFDEIGNLETKYIDERIKKAESDLKTKYTKTGQESIDFYANSILDESYDKSMANSKYSKRRLKDQTDGFSSFGLDDYLDEESGTLFPRQKTQKELNKDLNVNRRILTGSPSEKKFMDLSTMPIGPRQGSEMDNFVARANEYHKNIGSGIQVNSDLMRLMQEAKKEEKNMSIADMVKVYGAEAILGTQGNQGQPIKQKPMYDYAEGGITGLRSKYEYKK